MNISLTAEICKANWYVTLEDFELLRLQHKWDNQAVVLEGLLCSAENLAEAEEYDVRIS